MIDEHINMYTLQVVIGWIMNLLSTRTIGLYEVSSIEASSLLKLTDGASNISGCRRGIAKIIMQKQPLAFFTHYYGNSFKFCCIRYHHTNAAP